MSTGLGNSPRTYVRHDYGPLGQIPSGAFPLEHTWWSREGPDRMKPITAN